MSQLSRRSLAKGAAWAAPVVVAASTVPAFAASRCSDIHSGQPLPASAFQATYLVVNRETLGTFASKQVDLTFGFRVSATAAGCLETGSHSISATAGGSSVHSFTLSNGKTYPGSNGGSVPANGSVGSPDSSCQSGLAGTEACGTSGISAYNVDGSSGTSSYTVTAVKLRVVATVSGYGTTTFYINASGIPATGTRAAATLRVTAA